MRFWRRWISGSALALAAQLVTTGQASAREGDVVFRDVTSEVGVSYARAPSPTIAGRHAVNALPVVTGMEVPLFPLKADGAPGVAILDYDRDGDLDFFVPNGPGTDHSLFQNQLSDTGELSFVDVAAPAGVAATAQDGTGTCFGDIDNDGDHDLLVLGRAEQHRLFLNHGDGSFSDLGAASGLGVGVGAASCAMGDIDHDGLLDIAIAETFDWSTLFAIAVEPFALNVHNQLYVNRGGAVFSEEAEARGFLDLESGGMPPGAATITWAVTMVDYDEDGDVDILHGDDQAAVPGANRGGVDRGYSHVFQNDGTGHFTNVTLASGGDVVGHWMGFAWADYDCNGGLDFHNANVGDYLMKLILEGAPLEYQQGEWSNSWFLSNPAGGWDIAPLPTNLSASPWSWGSTAIDYDNDGDTDTVFQGGLHMGFIGSMDNPGVVLQNTGRCSGVIDWDGGALERSHTRRANEGLASGDLDGDGFQDLVSAAGFVVPEQEVLDLYDPWGNTPFDATAFIYRSLTPLNDLPLMGGAAFVWEGQSVDPGDVVVELNSGDNGNRWIGVSVQGSVGLARGGRVNRDGIGAVLTITPRGGASSRHPVAAGGPYASQDALERTFGLGRANSATVDVLWPGGVRNRLYRVRHGERVVLPEIPCSYERSAWSSGWEFFGCLAGSIADLRDAEVVDPREGLRLLLGMLRAYLDD